MTEPPILSVTESHVISADDEFREAMKLVAIAYGHALTTLSPGHPDLGWMRQAWRDARECAGLAPLRCAEDAPSLRVG